jgi:hypothetical protein
MYIVLRFLWFTTSSLGSVVTVKEARSTYFFFKEIARVKFADQSGHPVTGTLFVENFNLGISLVTYIN